MDLNDLAIYSTPYPEKKYCKPRGFLALNRSFLPSSASKRDHQLKHAINNLPGQNSDQQMIEDMVLLQKELHRIIGETAKSKLCVLIFARSAEAKVLYRGKVACTDGELQKAWRNQMPTKDVAKKYYDIYFALRDEPETWTRLIFQIAMDLKIWCTVTNPRLDLCKRGKKKDLAPKAHVCSFIVANKLRDSFRNPIFRSPPHGVSITITSKDRKVRRKKEFDFKENVAGWYSQKHKDFLNKFNGVRICTYQHE